MIGFIIWYALSSAVIMMVEPGINSYGDALWYLFVACTSIGFGDMVAVTLIGRMITVITTIMEILIVAVFSGVIVSFYLEIIRVRDKENFSEIMDKLEHLTELSQDELKEIENKVKRARK